MSRDTIFSNTLQVIKKSVFKFDFMKKFSVTYLHVGTDKTGTSSIQEMMEKSRIELEKRGVAAYPPPHTSLPLGGYFYDDPTRYVHFVELGITEKEAAKSRAKKALQDFMKWIEKAAPCERLVLSYEGYATMEKAALEKMRIFLEKHSRSINIIYYFRPPASYLRSAISQSVKFGRDPYKQLPIVNHKANIEKLESVFGRKNIILRKYDSFSLAGGDVVNDFLKVCDINSDYIKRTKNENESLSDAGVSVGLEIIRQLKKECVYDTFFPAHFYSLFGRFLNSIPGGEIPIDLIDLEKVAEASMESADFLKKNYGMCLNDDSGSYIEIKKSEATTSSKQEALIKWLVTQSLSFSDGRGEITLDNPPLKTQAGEKLYADCTIINNSCNTWYSTTKNPINIGYFWTDSLGEKWSALKNRASLQLSSLHPRQAYRSEISLFSPTQPGSYRLEISLVRENQFWFEEVGFTPLSLSVDVT
ncbi:hypothetical protein [Modicisalibacter sp. 'Wilcox']|uniref:hypothetical protein n=1 Tax=Modicisalibacter sp. 'Wilcox' TaxID=2679914 RepID=UPI0013D41D10|nr:hypothetical protein [Modicisalibacter sp. 'Wilcox']